MAADTPNETLSRLLASLSWRSGSAPMADQYRGLHRINAFKRAEVPNKRSPSGTSAVVRIV
jgi:hypothetical protein